MKKINLLYNNSFGVAFHWERKTVKEIKKVQIVFRDIGLLLTKEELSQFSENITAARNSASTCQDCKQHDSCKALLVDSPAPQISFAMNTQELELVHDLIAGILFQLDLDRFLDGLCEEI